MATLTPTKYHQHTSPVFKTPMTFTPRLAGEQARPSPSRIELWKEELGLDDADDCLSQNSDDEDMDDGVTKVAGDNCLSIEFQALQKELTARNAQRDELLFSVKMLSDKNRQYRSRLEQEESTKKHQLKILQKTHRSHLEEQKELIENLEALIEELEDKVAWCEGKGKTATDVSSEKVANCTKKLVEQICSLQSEKATLTAQLMTLQAKHDAHKGRQDKEVKELKVTNDKVLMEKSELEEKIFKMQATKGSGDTDTEKQLHKLEQENDCLQRDLMDSQRKLSSMQCVNSSSENDSERLMRKLQEENERLKSHIATLETTIHKSASDFNERETKWKGEIHQLTCDLQRASQETRELTVQLMALQAKSPEVVTRIERVQVESDSSKDALEKCSTSLSQSQKEARSLRSQLTALETKYKETELRLAEAAQQASQLEQVSSEQKQAADELGRVSSELERVSGERKQVSSELGRVSSELERVSGERDRISEELGQVSRDREEVSRRLQRLESEAAERDTQLTTSQGAVQQLQQQVERHRADMTSLTERMTTERDTLLEGHRQEVLRLRQEATERNCRLSETVSALKAIVVVICPEMDELRRQYLSLKTYCRQLPTIIRCAVEQTTKQIVAALSEISQLNQDLVQKYRKEMQLRKRYLNELIELKGNIRVFCRIRPKIPEDMNGPNAETVVSCDQADDAIVHVSNKGRLNTFELDRVFQPEATQKEVFSEVHSLVLSCLDGYNVCIFAYGQTGSGKTYTMEGTKQDPGINQRALQELFLQIDERSADWSYTISVSVLEIYNETIRDLLSAQESILEVKMSPEGGLHVPGLASFHVHNVEDVNEVFSVGQENRATAATNMNEHSSRSHALMCVTVVGTNKTTAAKSLGKLNLVDLAGSERVSKSGADGARLKEAQSINKSLSSIGDVIHALRSKQPHVPYRNSKLTYLLQDSLGGDSKTLMIVQVAPVEKNVSETLTSLNFAKRVRTVELGAASRKTETAEQEHGHGSRLLTPNRPTSRSTTPSRLYKRK